MRHNLLDDFTSAWEVRGQNFSPDIYFFAPSMVRYEGDEFNNKDLPSFVPVSVTGVSCSLRCDHCQGRILQDMISVSTPDELFALGAKLSARNCNGLLISGGSMPDGSVPLEKYTPIMKELKERYGLKIVVHTGLVDKKLAYSLSKASIDAAMIDIIGSDVTINSVYHLDAKASDFERSIRLLIDYGINIAPHLVIGLHYGEILGEYKALEMMSAYDLTSLVLVILNPISQTPMAKIPPPSPEEAAEVFVFARGLFPRTPILLGCARPGGEHRFKTDTYALKAGFNGIAYPADGIISSAREMGYSPKFSEFCCSLVFDFK